jgi:hypothetical protein
VSKTHHYFWVFLPCWTVKVPLPLELNGFAPLLQEWIPSTVAKVAEHHLGHFAIHQRH